MNLYALMSSIEVFIVQNKGPIHDEKKTNLKVTSRAKWTHKYNANPTHTSQLHSYFRRVYYFSIKNWPKPQVALLEQYTIYSRGNSISHPDPISFSKPWEKRRMRRGRRKSILWYANVQKVFKIMVPLLISSF